ncbi:MAG TPA: hydrolase [Pyrinomonadaceae bacterium]|jgi:nicotinamidase-related amidase|nr:hydrolase [Pyrinomonadaceae bacterium]
MSHPNLLNIDSTALVVIDVQEAFRNAIPDFSTVASRISTAVRGFQLLGVPVLVTEQYPKGLGPTAEEITFVLPDDHFAIEKTAFSSCGASAFVDRLKVLGTKQLVVCGLETHICVSQTAHDLLDRGFQVQVLTECVCSRFSYNRKAGLAKMKASGVIPSSVEMALFELMRDSKHDKFKEIQELIK